MTAKQYVAAWLALLAVPGFVWYLATTGPVQGAAFRLVVPEDVYLQNLRDPTLACESLSPRRPEAVVIGDSHSYAGWDFTRLETAVGKRVGACSLGGLYIETVPLLLDHVLKAAPGAGTVILGLSPRMFWDSPSKKEQIDSHLQLIPSIKSNAAPFLKQRFLGTALPYDRTREAIARHAGRIESLDEDAIAARLAQSQKSILSLRLWIERLPESRQMPDVSAAVSEICARVRQYKLHLWVLHIPESPWLEARYSDALWDAYQGALKDFSACAEKIVADKAVSYGLGNRHYVNRELRDDHDYGMWQRAAAITEDSAFDADHLNLFGASIFTPIILRRVGVP